MESVESVGFNLVESQNVGFPRSNAIDDSVEVAAIFLVLPTVNIERHQTERRRRTFSHCCDHVSALPYVMSNDAYFEFVGFVWWVLALGMFLYGVRCSYT